MKTIKKTDQVLKIPGNSIICAKNVYFPKDTHKTQCNNNVLVIGNSGCGKTRSVVRPALLQAEGSYVISDPKGMLYKDFKNYFESKGYKVYKLDFIRPKRSIHYNPIMLCKDSQDVLKLAHAMVYASYRLGGSSKDPFWDEATLILLSAIIGFMVESPIPDSDKTIAKITKLISSGKRDKTEIDSPLKRIFDDHALYMESQGKFSWASHRFDGFNTAAEKTYNTILLTTCAKLASFDTEELNEMLQGNDLDFTSLGREKVAVFVETSDTDRSMDTLVNIFYTQLMNTLCDYADNECENNALPVPVQFILDDFATNAKIDNFENMISNIRSRNISAMIFLQSESQLKAVYGNSAPTIINNCNTHIFMGGSEYETVLNFARRVDKDPTSLFNMPVGSCYVYRFGSESFYSNRFELEPFEKQCGFVPGKPCQKVNLL